MASVRFKQTEDSLWDVRFHLADGILLDQVSDLYDINHISNIVSDSVDADQLVQRVRFRVHASDTDDVLRIVKQARWLLTYH
jgi:hypothetical protein